MIIITTTICFTESEFGLIYPCWLFMIFFIPICFSLLLSVIIFLRRRDLPLVFLLVPGLLSMDFLGFWFLKTSFVFITFYNTYAELNSHMPFTQSIQFNIALNFEEYFCWGWNSRFSTFKISLHSLISVAKSVISLPVAPLQVICLFSSVTFKIFIFVFGF